MSDDPETTAPTAASDLADVPFPQCGVPFIYLDGASCHGVLAGAIQIELIARILVPRPDGGVDMKVVTTARLRCSPSAAKSLRLSIDQALNMAEQPQQQPSAAASKLN